MRVMIIGADGQLGTDLVKALQRRGTGYLALTETDIEVADRESVRSSFERHRPNAVLNCSVYHPVDECELHPERSFAVNTLGVHYLSLAARDCNSVLVHFSSDYVFDGEQDRPYRETDHPAPRSVFGVCKVAGEQLIRCALPRHFIIRTSGLYGHAGSRAKGGGNFVETMLRLGGEKGAVRVVNDLRMAQTSTRDLAEQVMALIETEHYGTFHAANHGDYSWYEFALKIFAFAGMDVRVIPSTWSESPGVAYRPRYSVLENHRLQELGLDRMVTIDQALQEYLKERQSAGVQGAALPA